MTRCNGCGIEIVGEENAERRILCPNCGSTARSFEMSFVGALRFSDHIMMEAQHDGRTVAFRESERDGRASSADDHGNGSISMTLVGSSPQGEEETIEVSRILVRAMNQIGQTWNEPVVGTEDVDCVATHATSGTAAPLLIQVVRAIVDPVIWRSLASSGTLNKTNIAIEELTDSMADALKKKRDKIPPKQRSELVLALDSTHLPVLAFPCVVDCFHGRHGSTVAGSGFRSVWIVGPTESLTRRLDLDS
jgi:hypothetical protein